MASRVTVLGDAQAIPEEALDKLRQAGSFVERISGDGTSIASILAER
jgi:putative cell wall-binding protein